MTALGSMVLEGYPDWAVTSCDVSTLQTIDEAETSRHFRAVEAADVVVAHPISHYRDEAKLSLEAVRGTMRAGAELITFPSIVFEGTHGAFTYLGGRMGGYYMPYHNAHVIDMSLRGHRWDDVCARLADAEFYTAPFVLDGIEASLNMLRAREEQYDVTVRVSPMIEQMCRSVIVMTPSIIPSVSCSPAC